MFDVLIIGGGVSSMSCALILGSAHNKPFVADKKIGILTHQKASSLQDALFNNAYGIPPGKLGSELLTESTQHLKDMYPQIQQIPDEKVMKIEGSYPASTVITNKNSYTTKIVVLGVGASNSFQIEGLMQYVVPHAKMPAVKQRIQLTNTDHKVAEGIYAIGTLAGWRSQLSIAAGSGASVGTDILTLWNDGNHTAAHDSIRK